MHCTTSKQLHGTTCAQEFHLMDDESYLLGIEKTRKNVDIDEYCICKPEIVQENETLIIPMTYCYVSLWRNKRQHVIYIKIYIYFLDGRLCEVGAIRRGIRIVRL